MQTQEVISSIIPLLIIRIFSLQRKLKDKRRLGEDITYDKVEDNDTNGIKHAMSKKRFLEFLKSILMMKNKKTYDLYEALANIIDRITFIQLFAVLSLRNYVIKG